MSFCRTEHVASLVILLFCELACSSDTYLSSVVFFSYKFIHISLDLYSVPGLGLWFWRGSENHPVTPYHESLLFFNFCSAPILAQTGAKQGPALMFFAILPSFLFQFTLDISPISQKKKKKDIPLSYFDNISHIQSNRIFPSCSSLPLLT